MTTAQAEPVAEPVKTEAVTTPVSTPPPAEAAPVTKSEPVKTEPTKVDYTFEKVEGVDPEFDTEVIEIAKKLSLTKEQATAFRQHEIDLAKKEIEGSKSAAEAQKLEQEQQLAKWDADNKAHKEYGGLKYAETDIKIGKLIAQIGEKTGLNKALAENPNLIKIPVFRNMLAEWSNSISEATFIQSGNQSSQTVSDAQLFYGKR